MRTLVLDSRFPEKNSDLGLHSACGVLQGRKYGRPRGSELLDCFFKLPQNHEGDDVGR